MQRSIEIKNIKQRGNTRTVYADGKINELMVSMKQTGLLQPIGIKKVLGKYLVIFGNRRFMAAKKLGWKKIDCQIMDTEDDAEDLITNIVENEQRINPPIVDIGRAYSSLLDMGYTLEEVSARVSKPVDNIKRALECFNKIPKEYASKVRITNSSRGSKNGMIPATQANTIINLQKSHHLGEHLLDLYEYARQPNVTSEKIYRVGKLLHEGFEFKRAVAQCDKFRSVRVDVVLRKTKIDKLEKERGMSIGKIIKEVVASEL